MTIGALLIGLAVAILAVSYITRPFQDDKRGDLEQTIDQWVAQASARPTTKKAEPTLPEPKPTVEADEAPINFCPQCGRRVSPDHQFCPGCGTKLR
jgi:hypothetical protein